MATTSEQRSAISRTNGAKSKAPKTDAGKSISSRNSLKHAMSATKPTLPNEDLDVAAGRKLWWREYFRPSSPDACFLLDECVAATLGEGHGSDGEADPRNEPSSETEPLTKEEVDSQAPGGEPGPRDEPRTETPAAVEPGEADSRNEPSTRPEIVVREEVGPPATGQATEDASSREGAG